MTSRYDTLKALGICTSCGCQDAHGGRRTCRACTLKKMRCQESRRERREAAGLCPNCGAEAGEHVLCSACRARQRAANTRFRQRWPGRRAA